MVYCILQIFQKELRIGGKIDSKSYFRGCSPTCELGNSNVESHTVEDLTKIFCEHIRKGKNIIFLAISEEHIVGFAQCGLRFDYVEGTDSSPVGYLEGIFVLEEYKKRGYAKELLGECQNWAKDQGCLEFASDCELDNEESLKFHLKMGFAEANRIICFTKRLTDLEE